jgi:hypothetical protein
MEAPMPIKNRQQLLILLTIAAVGLFAGEHLVYNPLAHLWSSRQETIAKLRTRLNEGQRLVQREGNITSRWNTLRRNSLTNETSAAEQRLFRAIDDWAQSSRATITAITPQWKQDADEYMTLGCRVEASGDLDRLTRFLYRSEREPLALRIEAIELGARDKVGQQLTLGLQFSGLALLPEGNSQAADPAQTKR